MNPSEDSHWKQIRDALLETVGEPSDEDLRAVRDSVKHRIAGQRSSGRRFWIWNMAAVAGAVALFAVVEHVGFRQSHPVSASLSISSPVLASRELSQIALRSRPVPAHLRRTRLSAGIRSVAWTTQGDGSPQLKLTTADPDIVVLLPLDKASEKHEN